MSKPKRDNLDALLAIVAKRQAELQLKKCGGCRAVAASRRMSDLVAQLKKDPAKFKGITLADIYEWAGLPEAGVGMSSWTRHLKAHRPTEWAALLSVLPRASS